MKSKTIRMNKSRVFLMLVMMALVSALQLNAQELPDSKSPGTRAKALTDKMKENLPITDSAEYQKVYDINLEYAGKMAESFRNAGSKMEKLRAVKGIQKEKDRELKKLLSKEQYKNYQKMMDEAKQQMKSQYRNRQ